MSDGGAFINSGTYGCVFKPPIKCQRKKSTSSTILNAAGKIFPDEHSFKDEYAELKKVRRFDPKHHFTVPYLGHCKVHVKDFRPSDETDKCLRHISPSRRVYNQLIYQYGGIDLSEYYKNPGKYFIHFENLVGLFQPLMEGVRLMGKRQIAHVDIKPDNVLLDLTIPKMYIIDFGLSTPFKVLKYETNFHVHEYPYYPPEFKLLSVARSPGWKPKELKETFLRNFRFYGQNRFLSWIERRWPSYSAEVLAFFTKFANRTQETIEQEFDNVFVDKLDSYSLAMTMIEIIYRLETSKNLIYRESGSTMAQKLLAQVLFPMVRPDAYQRMNIEEALQAYQFVVYPPAASRLPSPTPNANVRGGPVGHPTPAASRHMVMTHPGVAGPSENLGPVAPGSAVPAAPGISQSLQDRLPKSYTDCKKLKNKEIQGMLKGYKLPSYGTKEELCARLMKKIVGIP